MEWRDARGVQRQAGGVDRRGRAGRCGHSGRVPRRDEADEGRVDLQQENCLSVPVITPTRLTVTLPTDMAALVRGAVDEGDYASSSEVIREALREWKMKRELQSRKFATLKSDIDRGLADVAAGRIVAFNAERIIERGRKLLRRN